jgi:hypothetical protein
MRRNPHVSSKGEAVEVGREAGGLGIAWTCQLETGLASATAHQRRSTNFVRLHDVPVHT